MGKTKAWRQRALEQAKNGFPLQPRGEQVQNQVKHEKRLVTDWSAYAKSAKMLGFDGFSGTDVENRPAWSQDSANNACNRSERADRVGKMKQRKPHEAFGQFGHPSPQDYRFKDLVWTRKPELATSSTERTLEDLYRDYPEKRLKGIQQNTLDLTANVVLQVTNEAAMQWLQKWCPSMAWQKIFDHIRPDVTTNEVAGANQFVVPKEALDLKGVEITVAEVFRKCHAIVAEPRPVQLTNLVELIDHCFFLCDILKDENRKSLFGTVKDMVHWLPVGLDCKKLDILQKARHRLQELNSICSAAEKDGKLRQELKKADRVRFRRERENEILEQALADFEEHKVAFRVELLKQLKMLLDSTNAKAL
ncbi:hypothetical protein F5B20DRAFT_595523 [Whalleya microplaca]|nr:hypothetical protein F5B20DRAFT_595523 [Whalleya microplaca]